MFWKPGDVFEIECPKCGFHVEFFKFDVKRKCRCGHEIVNPKINFGCAGGVLWNIASRDYQKREVQDKEEKNDD
jgi:hypothetical protein